MEEEDAAIDVSFNSRASYGMFGDERVKPHLVAHVSCMTVIYETLRSD
jgi:hypothetical protein